ncbi:kynurenine formamidase isoform X2 [Cephus cinctus]|uniref:Kynurenine formamidase isoform X2 n=1 Tax=Cephus cinctus TaxID=211228 RepID=A0AAJ7W362_CEPCN|nr:kynurenine formamidase isoform X2 [Cephus cinctus]
MSITEHEKLYSPSQWSRRFDSLGVQAEYSKNARNMTELARSATSCEIDISYGPSERNKYDIYDAPVLLFFHGGYWQEGSKDVSGFPAKTFVSQGIKVILGGYDLCPTVTVAEILSQVKSLTEKILKFALEWGSKSVWVGGHSAGAHLVASLLHDPEWMTLIAQKGYLPLLKGILLISGIYNVEPLLTTSYNNALKLTGNEAKVLSFGTSNTKVPILNIKVIVTVGECDSPAFVQESCNYAQKLVEFVDNVEYLLVRNSVDHYDIMEKLVDNNFILNKLLIKNIQ